MAWVSQSMKGQRSTITELVYLIYFSLLISTVQGLSNKQAVFIIDFHYNIGSAVAQW